MQRVVVFMGGSRDALTAVQQALPGSIKALAASGVVVPKSSRSGNQATGFSHQQLAVASHPGWAVLRNELHAAQGETVLLVIPGLLRIGGSTSRRLEILKQLTALADEVCVVSVVGDQLTLINDYYVGQVATWRISKRLEGALPRLLDNDLFVHERLLRPWYGDSPARYVAIPLNAFLAGHPLVEVLHAAGVELTRTPPVVEAAGPARLGSVGVEANRLLATYLRAEIRGFDPTSDGVAAASAAALQRAEKLGWCSDEFWGWTRRAADKALARFDASNHRFAQAVWGTGWTLPYPLERPSTRVDFLDLDVPVVDQIQRYVMTTAGKLRRERRAAR